MTQPGAATSTIVGRELLDASLLCGALYDMPDHVFRDPVSPDRAGTIHTSEQPPVRDGRGPGPFVQSRLTPIGNRNRADVSTLANQIHYGPVLLALLDVTNLEFGHLSPTQAAAEQYCQDCSITFALQSLLVGGSQKPPALIHGQPIAQPNAELLGPFHALDARGQFRTEQSAVGRLVGQAPYGGQAHIDGCRRKKSGLQFDPVAQDDMLAKGQARLGAVPGDEVVDRVRMGSDGIK